jgi:hypothetical protein
MDFEVFSGKKYISGRRFSNCTTEIKDGNLFIRDAKSYLVAVYAKGYWKSFHVDTLPPN